ncbi:MAG: transcription-repair coupling factor, partial [Psychrilyobacter sp.]|nr:transcription-repair coupling factor [Psychrilyobacter sp.]
MNFKTEIKDGKLYKGSIPFFLKNKKQQVIYISSSNKNIIDYYLSTEEECSVLKIENYNYTDDEFDCITFELLEKLKKENTKIIISIESIFREYFLNSYVLNLKKGEKYSLKDIINKLETSNFKKNYLVEKRGEYSLRGDILDIFS